MNDNEKTKLSIEDTLRTTLLNIREFIASLGEKATLMTQFEGQMYLSGLNRESLIRLLTVLSGVIEEYRQQRKIGLVINTATLKQELGVLAVTTLFATRESAGGELMYKPYVLGGVAI